MARMCPKCGSVDITRFTGKYLPTSEVFQDLCKACGFEGYMPDLSKIEEERLKQKLKKGKKA